MDGLDRMAAAAGAGGAERRRPGEARGGPAAWQPVCALDEIPRRGARVLCAGPLRLALFRTADDQVFALEDRCPHKGGPLSQGIVHGMRVTCPLHDRVIDLTDGRCAEEAAAVAGVPVRVEGGRVLIETAGLAALAGALR